MQPNIFDEIATSQAKIPIVIHNRTMVDRPIKKADRPALPVDSDGNPQASEAPKKSRTPRDGGGGKGGKKDSRGGRDEPRAPENLALMRGPKPSKAKPPVIKEAIPEVTEDVSAEDPSTEAPATEES